MSEEWEIDPLIRDEVRRIYLEWIGLAEMTGPEQEAMIEAESARLTGMVEEALGDTAHGYQLQKWRQEHPGQVPDYQTVVSLTQTERRSARQKIFEEELYPQLTEEILEQRRQEHAEIVEMTEQRIAQLRAARDPERWRKGLVVPSALAEQIVIRLWGLGRSMAFLELAVALISQRLEDDLPTPTTILDPVFEEIETMIEDAASVEVTPF